MRDEEAQARASQRQHRALDQQLRDDAYARGAEREPDSDFVLATRGVGEHQAGDVAARSQEDEQHRAEQQPERSAHAADLLFFQRHDRRRPSRVCLRILVGEPRFNGAEVGLALFRRHAYL